VFNSTESYVDSVKTRQISSKEMDTVRTPIHVNIDTTPVVFNSKRPVVIGLGNAIDTDVSIHKPLLVKKTTNGDDAESYVDLQMFQ